MSDPWYIKARCIAGTGVDAALEKLQGHSDRLGIAIQTEVNGVDLIAFPGRHWHFLSREYDARVGAKSPATQQEED